MTLVDTSVWIDHIRHRDEVLTDLLVRDRVLVHPFVVGEVAMGRFRQRATVLAEMRLLRQAIVASVDEVARFVENQMLFGLGIGYVDAHMLTSARLTGGARLWTRDKRLAALADRLKIGVGPQLH